MKSSFKLFSSHLDLAHFWWEKVVNEKAFVIDMTCGNGHDTTFLAGLQPKKLVALDIQPEAIASAKTKVSNEVEFLLEDHAVYPEKLVDNTVNLAVYNLGWLPGSDKSITTLTASTLKSIDALLPKMMSGGLISITCYPGHPEGEKEEGALLKRLSSLDPKLYSLCHHRWLNRLKAPSLILLQKA